MYFYKWGEVTAYLRKWFEPRFQTSMPTTGSNYFSRFTEIHPALSKPITNISCLIRHVGCPCDHSFYQVKSNVTVSYELPHGTQRTFYHENIPLIFPLCFCCLLFCFLQVCFPSLLASHCTDVSLSALRTVNKWSSPSKLCILIKHLNHKSQFAKKIQVI